MPAAQLILDALLELGRGAKVLLRKRDVGFQGGFVFLRLPDMDVVDVLDAVCRPGRSRSPPARCP
jgi:hypothetical protein